jgi:DNA-directed RNA polymerase specialized sigma24 family protein
MVMSISGEIVRDSALVCFHRLQRNFGAEVSEFISCRQKEILKLDAVNSFLSWARRMNAYHNGENGGGARFGSTCWSVVLSAAQNHEPAGQAALAELYRIYWYPLYCYVRRRGHTSEDAEDLTQGFFVHLLEHRALAQVDPRRGKFRSFLLASLQNFLSVAYEREHAIKRGRLCAFIPLDATTAESRFQLESVDELTAEQIFDARWALTLLKEAMKSVRQQYSRRGKQEIFEVLKTFLRPEGGEAVGSYHRAAMALGVSDAAVKTWIHRLRRHYSLALRREVARTVLEPAAIDEEIRVLCAALVAAEGRLPL